MRKMKGGDSIKEYNIDKVLGQNFEHFFNLMSSNKNFDPFKVKQAADSSKSGTTVGQSQSDLNDLSSEYFEELVAIAAAFKAIENPDFGKAAVVGKYGGIVEEAINNLMSGKSVGAKDIPKNSFTFDQLPYDYDNGYLKHLVPGFHMLPYKANVYPNYSTSSESGLVNAIRYLYHFIALLDTSTLDARDVITFLRQDNLNFNKFVNDILTVLSSSQYFVESVNIPSPDTIVDGIYNGLVSVAAYIITKFNNIREAGVPTLDSIDKFTGDTTGKAFINYLNTIIPVEKVPLPAPAVDKQSTAARIDTLLQNMSHLSEPGPNARLAIPDSDHLKQMTIHGLYNPIYLDEQNVMASTALGPQGVSLQNVPPLQPSKNVPSQPPPPGSWNPFSWFAPKQPVAPVSNAPGLNAPGLNAPPIHGAPIQIVQPSVVMSLDDLYGTPISNPPPLRRNLIHRPEQGDTNGVLIPQPTTGPGSSGMPFAYPAVQDNIKNFITKYLNNNGFDIDFDTVDENNFYKSTNAEFVNPFFVLAVRAFVNELLTANWTTPDENLARVQLLGLLRFYIEGGSYPTMASNVDKIKGYMREALKGYNTLVARLRTVPSKKFIETLEEFKDLFITDFTLLVGKYITMGPAGELRKVQGPAPQGKSVPRPSGPAKNNLAVPEIRDFYRKVILTNISFYDKFFNLVKIGTAQKGYEEIPLAEAESLSDQELANYRLNVKKEIGGYSKFAFQQYGGLFGDIVIIGYIPDYPTDGSLGNVRISGTERITKAQLMAQGPEAIRSIFRSVYNSAPDVSIVDIYGYQINIKVIAQKIARVGPYNLNWQEYYKSRVSRSLDETVPKLTPAWRESEAKLNMHILKAASEWVRDGDNFVRRKPNGDIIEEQENADDSCAFINLTGTECIDFLVDCALSDENFPNKCKMLFDLNTPITFVKEKVLKINPKNAFGVLQKFKFASYLDKEAFDPVRDFRRYKVQSVGEWVEELLSGADRCANPNIQADPCHPSLKDQLGPVADQIIAMVYDKKYAPFFEYLDILVNWVNANPQVLNKEEAKYVNIPSNYPDFDKSFNTYTYKNPHKPAYLKLRSIGCGLERLKSSIINELSGSNAMTMVSNIASVPLGLELPLNRSAFTSPVPYSTMVPLFGGQPHNIELELQKLNGQYGYILFNEIYLDLGRIMVQLSKNRNIRLGENTRMAIESKLQQFKQLEEEIRKSLIGLIERNKLYQASRGYVNAYDIPNENLPDVLLKHSNILTLSAAYNKLGIKLINLFQTISSALSGKFEGIELNDIDEPKYERPLTMGYHNVTRQKKNARI